MKNDFTTKKCNSEIELLDGLLAYKLDSQTVANSEIAISNICEAVDGLQGQETGYVLMSITNDKKSLMHLIMKRNSNWNKYYIYTWEIEEKIEKGIDSKIHSADAEDLYGYIEDTINNYKSSNEKFNYDVDSLIPYIITESLKGYTISKKKLSDQCDFLASHGKTRGVEVDRLSSDSPTGILKGIAEFVFNQVQAKRQEVKDTIFNFASRLDCDKLSLKIAYNDISLDKGIIVGKITKVIQNNNVRTYQVKSIQFNNTKVSNEVTVVANAKAGVHGNTLNLSNLSDLWIAETRPSYWEDVQLENFLRIPYNHVDEGRILLGIPRSNGTYDIIFGGDPRIDADPVGHLKDVLGRYVDTLVKNLTKLSGTQIFDQKTKMLYDQFESLVSKDSQEVKPLQIRLKALKKMVEEYQYIVKKQESIGTDVKISDKVSYNHKEGRVSYNDFSIAVNDEMLKSRLFQTFESYLVTYFRGETTEETILNDILNKIFDELKNRINSYSSEDTVIKIVLNDKITIDLEMKTTKNKAKLLYLNGQRFNKNEVLTVLREITCYRSQEEANRFISNIGKLGLSVYIGITSGYEIELDGAKKLFRFKKLKGRSNYTMILDTIEIPIKGKELVNTLFSRFVGEHVPDFQKKIPKIIFDSVESSSDYAKYRFLIDSAYESFKNRSLEFLTKKVKDVDGEFCKYHNANGKRMMTAITLVGASGHRYVIAYDNKDSYVFMDPELKQGEKNTYENGKYICMIDQSNIKSNIGFDTVISKLLALKNDSVVAGTIYNLEEELSE